MQTKFENFVQADEVRIKKVWDMNETEAKELVKKIMHCDQVIHEQQLNVNWKAPNDKFFDFLHDNAMHGTNSGAGDSSYKGADSETQGKSQMNQNTSIMDSQNQGQSRSEIEEDQDAGLDIRDEYEKIKNVFKLLIDEAEYLIDDKALEKCHGKSLKEQFQIKIDSIRKSLGIDELKYVQLLVKIFYSFQENHEQDIQNRMVEEEAEYNAQENENGHVPLDDGLKRGDIQHLTNGGGSQSGEPKVVDPNELKIDPDLITSALAKFYTTKEDLITREMSYGAGKKKSKRSNFQTEKEVEEQKRKSEKIFWEKLVSILTE